MIWIYRNASRPAECFNREWGVRAHHFHPLVLGLSVSIDSQIDGHAEQVEVLGNFTGHAEAGSLFVFGILRRRSTQTIGRVFHLKFRSAGRVQPLRKEPRELASEVLLRDLPEVVRSRRFSG